MMTRIKICGITNEADAANTIESGADALGFNLVPSSPRYVGDRPDMLEVVRRLPPLVTRVAIARAAEDVPAEWLEVLDVLQIYSAPTQTPERRVVQAFRVRSIESLQEIETSLAVYRPGALLLDTYHKEMLGGSGQTFDWSVAEAAVRQFALPVFLAGGLTSGNVAEAVLRVRPYAVDVASGVERAPGYKDHREVRAFIHAVRAADAAISAE